MILLSQQSLFLPVKIIQPKSSCRLSISLRRTSMPICRSQPWRGHSRSQKVGCFVALNYRPESHSTSLCCGGVSSVPFTFWSTPRPPTLRLRQGSDGGQQLTSKPHSPAT